MAERSFCDMKSCEADTTNQDVHRIDLGGICYTFCAECFHHIHEFLKERLHERLHEGVPVKSYKQPDNITITGTITGTPFISDDMIAVLNEQRPDLEATCWVGQSEEEIVSSREERLRQRTVARRAMTDREMGRHREHQGAGRAAEETDLSRLRELLDQPLEVRREVIRHAAEEIAESGELEIFDPIANEEKTNED
jgi:hypothetical protein